MSDMSYNNSNVGIQRSVIAVAKQDNKLRAVKLRELRGALEVLWTKSSEGADVDWQLFATECGLSSVESGVQKGIDSDRTVIVGFISTGVVFYRINVPAVSEEEIASIVKLQAETLLPLPAEQIEMTWRTNRTRNGQESVTIAAARREQLQRYVENVKSFKPTKILLDCEGIVKSWRELFSGTEANAVIISSNARNTWVCLAEGGRLSNAVVLDTGIEDFSVSGLEEQTETTERFAQDMISVLDLFSYDERADLPIFVLSDGSDAYVSMVSSLTSAGLNARVALPQTKTLSAQSELSVESIYEYRVPIGLALMALEAREDGLNIFNRLYNPAGKDQQKHWLYTIKAASMIAAAMLVLLMVISYAIDVASPGAIEKHFNNLGSDIDINMLIERQQLIKTIAQERPDLLDLLGQVSASGDGGIKLESFHFKKGQPVSIGGQAPSNEQLYRFEKSLQDRRNITDVKMNSSPDAKTKKLKFTMTFHYKNFTK